MVAIAGHLMRFSFGGKHFGTEAWSNTLHYDSPGTDQPAKAAMEAALAQFVNCMSEASQIGWWKYNEISTVTGKYVSDTSFTYEVNPVVIGGFQATIPQAATVASLLSDNTRGPAHSGRIYLPISSPVDKATGLMSASGCVTTATSVKQFINAVTATKTHLPIIWSQTYKQAQPIRKIAVGRVVDTQRSRRRSLIESAQPVSLTGP